MKKPTAAAENTDAQDQREGTDQEAPEPDLEEIDAASDLGEDFDLDDLRPVEEPRRLHLSHPQTGADLYAGGKPLVVWVLGPDHPTMRAHDRKTANRRLQQASRTGQITMTAKQTEEDALTRAVLATERWENIRQGGKEVPCDEANKRRIYKEWPWMRRQVDAFHGNAGNFLSGATES